MGVSVSGCPLSAVVLPNPLSWKQTASLNTICGWKCRAWSPRARTRRHGSARRQLSLLRRRGRGHKSDPDSALIAPPPSSSRLLVFNASPAQWVACRRIRLQPPHYASAQNRSRRREMLPESDASAEVTPKRPDVYSSLGLFISGKRWGWRWGGRGGQAEWESMEARVKRDWSPFRRSALNFLNVLI